MSFINTVFGIPLGYVMWGCYQLVKNYGLSIILFTLHHGTKLQTQSYHPARQFPQPGQGSYNLLPVRFQFQSTQPE